MTKGGPSSTPVAPGGTIGILGGGQLGRMLALAAARLGLKAHISSDESDAPAFQVCAKHTLARYDDEKALDAFSASCDVVTFEFENVPAATVEILARRKPIFPSARALAIAQRKKTAPRTRIGAKQPREEAPGKMARKTKSRSK